MTFRKLFAVLLALLLTLTFAACDKADDTPTTTAAPTEPPITAEYLYQQLAVTAAETPITSADVEGEQDITMNFVSIGTSTTTSLGTTGTMTYSPEQGIRYSELTEGISAYGQLTTEDTLNYTLEEDGVSVTYTYNETTGLWTRRESSHTMRDFCAGALTPDSLTLEEATQTMDGKEVYILHAQFSGDVLESSIASASSLLASLDLDPDTVKMDMSCLSASVTYYIDAETLLLVQVDASIEGMGEALTGVIVEYVLASLEEAKDELGSEYASMVKMYKQLTVTVPLNTNSYTNISYEPVTVPELPAEAKEAAALQEYDPLQADGSYVLKELGGTVSVTPPAEWSVQDSSYNALSMLEPDEYNEIFIYLLTGMDHDLFVEQIDQIAADYKAYTEYDIYESHGLGDVVNGWQTAYIKCDSMTHDYYAWKQINDDLWVLVEYDDYYGASMNNTLLSLLDTITITAD